jgi:hypothetical protein
MTFHALLRCAVIGMAILLVGGAARSQSPSPSHSPPSPCEASARAIPQRQAMAPDAGEFVASVARMTEPERDTAIRRELLSGNIPGFLRHVLPTTLSASLPGGETIRLTMCVLADYLSVGSDKDFLRVPMGLDTALAVAASFGFALPTRHIVDLIYRQASVRLSPQPLPAGNAMRSTDYYVAHQAMVQQQREATGAPADALTAGHKKDLVLSPRLWSQAGRVAIYGWHRGIGLPVQPLSTVHGARYADYSHGVRLIGNVVYVNGEPRSIYDVLADEHLAPLLSDEGPIPRAAELQRNTAALSAVPVNP